MRALIIGAGIGGLSAALCLRARGWDVEVREASPELGEVGAGLQIPPNAMRVWRALGLDSDLQGVSVRADALEAVRADGNELFRIALEGEPWGAPYLHIHRADYIDVLGRALRQSSPDALKLGCPVDPADIADMEADIIVAADGIRSPFRTTLFDPAPHRWTGNVAWRAVVPTSELPNPPPPTARVWMGSGRHAVTYRLRDGDLVNFVGVVEQDGWREEGWNTPGEREEAQAAFAAFAPMVRDILEDAPHLHKWALFDRAPFETWVGGRVALLGDAAHPMLPFMAQGAAMAVEDAWVLADALDGAGGVEAGLRDYVRRRQPRAARVQAVSRRNAKLFHLGGAEAAVAHTALRLGHRLAPALLRRRFDWLYGYDPTEGKSVVPPERLELPTP